MPDIAEPTGSCPCCLRRDPEYGRVCEPDRRWFPIALRSIAELHARLAADLAAAPEADDRRRPLRDNDGRIVYDGHGGIVYTDQPADPVAHRLTAGPAASVAIDEPVTASSEPSTPLNLDAADLVGPVIRDGGRPIDVTGDNWVIKNDTQPREVWHTNRATGRQEKVTLLNRRRIAVPAGDQIGHIPVTQVLDQEVRAWIAAGAPGARWRPAPTVPTLAGWLAARLDWACDNYDDIDAFADALRDTRGKLMAALGEFDPPPQPCEGVECNRCDKRMLFRTNDGSGDVRCENPACRRVFRAEEYEDWIKHLAGFERSERSPEEIRQALKRRGPAVPEAV